MALPIRQALRLLPPCATTGIGSLPHTQLELGLQMALQVDVPYLPQLPNGNPSELMIASALDGLPGMRFDNDGLVTIELEQWQAKSQAFGDEIEASLQSDALERYEPSSQACRGWKPFLWEVENRKLAFAKIQIAGPATVGWSARTSTGQPASAVPELDRQIFRLLLARAIAMVKAVRRANATPLIYLDEPGLYALTRRDPMHVVTAQELKLMVLALRREGALVGLHCCSNTDWGLVLELGLDLISLDVRLSLDAILEEVSALERYLDAGSTLSLGIVPTNANVTFDIREIVDAVDVSLRAALGARRANELLRHLVLTPACGLALRSVIEAEKTFEELRTAQRLLRSLAEDAQRPQATA